MGKKKRKKFTGSQAGGRRKVRSDSNAIVAAFEQEPAETVNVTNQAKITVISMGPVFFKIWKKMVETYQRQGSPLSLEQRDAIVAEYSKSPGSVIMCQLRDKEALVTDDGDTHHDKDVVPRFNDVIIMRSRSQQILYPSSVAGTMGVEEALILLSSAKSDAPKAPRAPLPAPAPTQTPAPTQKQVARIRTKEEIAIELQELTKHISKLAEQGKARKLEQAKQELQSLLAKIAEVNQTLLGLYDQETALKDRIRDIEDGILSQEQVLKDPSILDHQARLNALLENYDTTIELLVR